MNDYGSKSQKYLKTQKKSSDAKCDNEQKSGAFIYLFPLFEF